eukprot:2428580-Prymnesium_polylepis.1
MACVCDAWRARAARGVRAPRLRKRLERHCRAAQDLGPHGARHVRLHDLQLHARAQVVPVVDVPLGRALRPIHRHE